MVVLTSPTLEGSQFNHGIWREDSKEADELSRQAIAEVVIE